MFDFNKSLMFLHKKADLPTYKGVCPALNRLTKPAGPGSINLTHTHKSTAEKRGCSQVVSDCLCVFCGL